jgi:hypothetical protein
MAAKTTRTCRFTLTKSSTLTRTTRKRSRKAWFSATAFCMKAPGRIRRIDFAKGRIDRPEKFAENTTFPKNYFAEGMTFLNDKIYQLTWRSRTAFVYDADFQTAQRNSLSGDGWGLTHDGTNLIMSDGTHIIRFVNPENFQTVRTITVFRENGQPLLNLNELEYVKGEIWANIWHSEQPNILRQDQSHRPHRPEFRQTARLDRFKQHLARRRQARFGKHAQRHRLRRSEATAFS